jgi:hypothetical protein
MATCNGYSSKVALRLLVGGADFALSHVGSRSFVVRDRCKPQPAGDAELVIEVNDSEERYKIHLTQGLPGPNEVVEYVVIEPLMELQLQLLRRLKSWPSLST